MTYAMRSDDWGSDAVEGSRLFSTSEARRLEGGIAYVAFNAFLPSVLPSVREAFREMADAPGRVIDLRGNHGDEFPVRRALVDMLVSEPVAPWTTIGEAR